MARPFAQAAALASTRVTLRPAAAETWAMPAPLRMIKVNGNGRWAAWYYMSPAPTTTTREMGCGGEGVIACRRGGAREGVWCLSGKCARLRAQTRVQALHCVLRTWYCEKEFSKGERPDRQRQRQTKRQQRQRQRQRQRQCVITPLPNTNHFPVQNTQKAKPKKHNA